MVNPIEFRLGNAIVNATNGLTVVDASFLNAIQQWYASYNNFMYHPDMKQFLNLPKSCDIACGVVTTGGKILMYRHGKQFASCDYFHQMQNSVEDEYGAELEIDFNGIVNFIVHTV